MKYQMLSGIVVWRYCGYCSNHQHISWIFVFVKKGKTQRKIKSSFFLFVLRFVHIRDIHTFRVCVVLYLFGYMNIYLGSTHLMNRRIFIIHSVGFIIFSYRNTNTNMAFTWTLWLESDFVQKHIYGNSAACATRYDAHIHVLLRRSLFLLCFAKGITHNALIYEIHIHLCVQP